MHIVLLRILGVALLYLIAARLGLSVAVVGNTVTPVWPPSGIALVALLLGGYRMAAGVALGALLANAWTGVPAQTAIAIAIGNTLAALAAVWLLQRVAGFQSAMGRRRDVVALITLGAAVSTIVSASIGTTALTITEQIPLGDYFMVWLAWWLGDTLGVLLVAPPLLIAVHHRLAHLAPGRLLELGLLVAGLVLVGYLVFVQPDSGIRGYYPAALAVFPFIVWAALRFTLLETSLATALVSALAIWSTTQGFGPLAAESAVDGMVRWCAFANLLATSGLLLAASGAEHRRVQIELQRSHDELEQRVLERTAALARINEELKGEMTERRRLESELIRSSEDQQRSIGRELHDGLGQYFTSIALFGAALRQQLDQRGLPEADAAHRIVDMLDNASDMIRDISRGLYPATLDAHGLVAAMRELASQTQALEKITCTFRASAGICLDNPLIAINLYRIAQEAISNAIRHGGAHHIRLDLSENGTTHCLSISDDGSGCDTAQFEGSSGLGLHSMRYRAALLGGTFSISRNRRGGMTVRVIYPSAAGAA